MSMADLEKSTFYFEILDGRLVGDGARFLADELKQSQFVLLGEYHGSARISEFTKAIIPILHDAGHRTFALEIGPISAEILSELSTPAEQIAANLRIFNSKHHVVDNGRTFTAIPFFSNTEDAEFLVEARKRKWNLLGLDQEFSFSYVPLLDRMYDNLPAKKKRELEPLYKRVIDFVKNAYEADIKERKSQYKAINDAKEVNEFLLAAERSDPENKRIADAIRFTTGIYHMNDGAVRKYYEANSGRVDYMKRNLATGFSRLRFDQKKDRMLLKMGAVHTGRGFSNLSLFEIGNTLSELAAFHGNSSLHIEFGSRHYTEGGRTIDALDNANSFAYRFRALLQMAHADKWTVIDLRPLRKTVFYARKFNLDPVVLEVFKNQDLYIIPPVEKDPTPNY